MPPKLLYQRQVSELKTECPPKSAETKNTPCYRLSMENHEHNENFLPRAITGLGLGNRPVQCDDFGLSFYDNLDGIRKLRKNLSKRIKNIIWKKILQGTLEVSDGLQTVPNSKGHFDLHVYEEVLGSLPKRFEVIIDYSDDKD